jgi:uncharacterized protein YecE (DUF72 family)
VEKGKGLMMPRPARIRIGTSGWNYNHWRERFYPPGLPSAQWLAHFQTVFDTVELNNSFYHLPEIRTFDKWRDEVPADFLFSVKANRFLTHVKKLKDTGLALRKFLGRARHLQTKLGPILYQLPPRWNPNLERLDEFCARLPKDLIHVIEFRQRDWLNDQVYEILRRHAVNLCVHDLLPDHPRVITGSAVYIRFHGVGAKYGGNYGRTELEAWAGWMREQAAKGRSIFAYFNNDLEGHAIMNAKQLKELLGLK